VCEPFPEMNVSGGAPLERRSGLRQAVEMIEAGEADVIVVGYFDRLVRSVRVQAEVAERVEQAGGKIYAVDFGQVRTDTASHWLSSTMLGMVAEYQRRSTAERTEAAKLRAVERRVPPFPRVPPGYRRKASIDKVTGKRLLGPLEMDPKKARCVAKAFELRASGATVMEVREHLRRCGIERSFHGVQSMLGSRLYIGELRFGQKMEEFPELAIVDRDVFDRVQRARSPRGRRPKSERLLSRLGVLRCASCGARMVIGTTIQNGKTHYFYRCPPIGDCTRRVTISADIAEQTIIDAVKELLKGVTGSASIDAGLTDAEDELERAEAELDAAVRAFSGLDDVDAARERLTELRNERDAAREQLEELRATVMPAIKVSTKDWNKLTLEEQRALIRAVVEQAYVWPGRGPDRISVEPRR